MKEKEFNLKPFNLKEAKAGKSVCTRDGRKARIICFDRRDTDNYYIIALIEDKEVLNKESVRSYFDNGKYLSNNEESVHDLMMLPEKKEGWINIYSNGDDYRVGLPIYNSKKEALNNKASNAIDTVKIEWEE